MSTSLAGTAPTEHCPPSLSSVTDRAALDPSGASNQNPSGISLWQLLREDYQTHDNKLLEQGFWAIAVHRFGNWRMGIHNRVLRWPLSVLYKLLYRFVEWTCGISLPYTVRVGRQVRLWHHGGMILNAAAIGDRVQVRQNTTFGVVRTQHNFELPILEDDSDIGVGACILGEIRVGRGAVIGANAVVLKDVPDYAVAVGVPAVVVKQRTPPADESDS
ncbi:Serine acetyltransferase [Posidoniimonas polymericola]|uniref:Serine acetyltransferase n=1 Tax=Posidoniimonas polymericola TaxID=2528002 RepID=A0A5C5ZGB7_9BACT|nr:transferase [Posidoniimonas polymericola]TWT85921.1 Serine acetyltransferase [Posidoniimonas polymericola]